MILFYIDIVYRRQFEWSIIKSLEEMIDCVLADDAMGVRFKYQNVISIDETDTESDFSDMDTVDSKSR